jgi:hypothetical protein
MVKIIEDMASTHLVSWNISKEIFQEKYSMRLDKLEELFALPSICSLLWNFLNSCSSCCSLRVDTV